MRRVTLTVKTMCIGARIHPYIVFSGLRAPLSLPYPGNGLIGRLREEG
jgi:hypothetical protein